MKKSIGIFLILNLSFAIAQSISGTVTDENGNGLAGANVTVDGTNLGAAADVHLARTQLMAYQPDHIQYQLPSSVTILRANL